MRRSALIQVECFYNVPIPEDLELSDKEAMDWALKQFVKNNTVDIVESNDGENPFRHEHMRTLDGRVKDFDSIEVQGIHDDDEVDKILKAIQNGQFKIKEN